MAGRISTRTLLASSPTHFRINAALDAYKDKRRVCWRNWDDTNPRDLV